MKIKPLSDRVVVKAEAAQEKTASGIIIPDSGNAETAAPGAAIGASGRSRAIGSNLNPGGINQARWIREIGHDGQKPKWS